jgi:hypothetical protein
MQGHVLFTADLSILKEIKLDKQVEQSVFAELLHVLQEASHGLQLVNKTS